MLYDIFISHASEDKDKFVGPLAKRIRDNRIEVWYDEFTLKPGDSIRRSMGIAKSRYGILSSNGLEYVVSEITKIIKPEGSTLLNARDVDSKSSSL